MKTITPTQLRQDLYSILDKTIQSGRPQYVRRGEYIIEIQAKNKMDILLSMPKRDAFVGDPDDLIDLHIDEWNEEKNLE